MEEDRLAETIGLGQELINWACSIAVRAHKQPPGKPYVLENPNPSTTLIGFSGSWSVADWFANDAFGDTVINLHLFPSLKSIGKDEAAMINEAFLRRFEAILADSSFITEVEKAASDKKHIIFSGHSLGAPVAIFAALWLLENRQNQGNQIPQPHCITFGSPLVGDGILHHATRRENLARCFKHFVTRYDIIPRISLSSLSSIHHHGVFRQLLHYINPNSTLFASDYISKAPETSRFFLAVMRNAASVATQSACKMMSSTNPLLETVAHFVELSPYRPFGTYVFCTGSGKFIVVENPQAVLQLLFYGLQWASQAEAMEAAHISLNEHLMYESRLRECLETLDVVFLDHLEDIPLSVTTGADHTAVNAALNDLGITARARLCLRTAGDLEKQKKRNQAKIDNNKQKIEAGLDALQIYQERCKAIKVGYYDAFKLQRELEDFNSNVRRVELAGMWDEIIEMLKRYELPDEFEGRKDWIELGTRYRRIVEPLDIANYYRHSLNESTGPYMLKGRPNRYKFVQRWREHAMKLEARAIPESCVWAEIEELQVGSGVGHGRGWYESVKERVVEVERNVGEWVRSGEIGGDIFLKESTFVKWWKTLPQQHRLGSTIAACIYE